MSTILAKIKTIPPLDDTYHKVQEVCNQENSPLTALSMVIESDPIMVANILKAANAPLYGFSKEISNVSRAISLFGMSTIKGFVVSILSKKAFNVDMSPYGISNDVFVNRSNVQNAIMFNWYSRVNNSLMGTLSSASFLNEIGRIVIANELIQTGKADTFRTRLRDVLNLEQLSDLEKEFVGSSNEDVTSAIFEHWNLEPELIKTIRYSLNPNEAENGMIKECAKALMVVKNATNVIKELNPNGIAGSLKLIKEFGYDEQTFKNAVNKAAGV